jgi:hypothetical protein
MNDNLEKELKELNTNKCRDEWCRFCFYVTQPTSIIALSLTLFTTYALLSKLIDDTVANCLYVTSLPFWISQGTYKEKLKSIQQNFLIIYMLKKLLDELRK